MSCLGTQFSGGLGSIGFMVELDDLKGLFWPKWSYDSREFGAGTLLWTTSLLASAAEALWHRLSFCKTTRKHQERALKGHGREGAVEPGRGQGGSGRGQGGSGRGPARGGRSPFSTTAGGGRAPAPGREAGGGFSVQPGQRSLRGAGWASTEQGTRQPPSLPAGPAQQLWNPNLHPRARPGAGSCPALPNHPQRDHPLLRWGGQTRRKCLSVGLGFIGLCTGKEINLRGFSEFELGTKDKVKVSEFWKCAEVPN